MEIKLKFGVLALMSAFMTVSACGGGGGSGSGEATPRSSTGPITAFGSIYVNGNHYETDGADVYIEDEMSDESELRTGMMVTVVEDEHGNAASISHDDDLEGIVTGVDVAAGTIDVMGYTVTVTNETIFESYVASITDVTMIQQGHIIEVSGYSSGTGTISATRIEVKALDLASYLTNHSEGIEVKGVVMNHSADTSEFDIGSMTVNYATAILDDLPNGIDNNIYVEVKSTQGLDNTGVLIASKVEQEDDGSIEHEGDEEDEYEFSGIIMEIGADTITVNSQVVTITADTEIEDDGQGPLAVGDEVEVEGYFDANGNLIAEEIEREEDESSHVEFKDKIDTVVVPDPNDPNVGTITLMDGTVILVNNDTLMHDSQDEGVMADTHFNLSDLMSGDYIEVYATDNGDGTHTAIKIEREDMPMPVPM